MKNTFSGKPISKLFSEQSTMWQTQLDNSETRQDRLSDQVKKLSSRLDLEYSSNSESNNFSSSGEKEEGLHSRQNLQPDPRDPVSQSSKHFHHKQRAKLSLGRGEDDLSNEEHSQSRALQAPS